MLGLILDQNYNEPLHPIHSGPVAGPAAEVSGLGYYAVDNNPLGMTDETKGHVVMGAIVAGVFGLFLWKHRIGKKIVRKFGLGRTRRRRR